MSNIQAISPAPEDDVDAQVGRRVHQLIWDRRTTQTALGHAIGMDPSSIAKRLRGNLGWSAPQLVATARALKTTVAYLIGESVDPDLPDIPVGPAGFDPATSTVEDGRLAEVIPFRRAS